MVLNSKKKIASEPFSHLDLLQALYRSLLLNRSRIHLPLVAAGLLPRSTCNKISSILRSQCCRSSMSSSKLTCHAAAHCSRSQAKPRQGREISWINNTRHATCTVATPRGGASHPTCAAGVVVVAVAFWVAGRGVVPSSVQQPDSQACSYFQVSVWPSLAASSA
jgi:hypothetical protein